MRFVEFSKHGACTKNSIEKPRLAFDNACPHKIDNMQRLLNIPLEKIKLQIPTSSRHSFANQNSPNSNLYNSPSKILENRRHAFNERLEQGCQVEILKT
jgi:hypothetical protein